MTSRRLRRLVTYDEMHQDISSPMRESPADNGPAGCTPPIAATSGNLLHAETGSPVHVDILLWPAFDIHDLSALLDVFHLANITLRRLLFTWRIIGTETRSVETSCGLQIRTDHVFDPQLVSHNLLLLAGLDRPPCTATEGIGAWLDRWMESGTHIGLIGGAPALLAATGLLDGRCCVAHWAQIDLCRQRHQRVDFRDQIYRLDQGILSCSGGCGTTDLALAFVRESYGPETALKVADHLNRSLVRDEHDIQRASMPAASSLTREAAHIMRRNIEVPMAVSDIAEQLGTSLRRLQRSFRHDEKLTPTQFYIRERLLQARRLLRRHPSLSITGAARRCGFLSASDFSRNFTRQFGIPPSRLS